MYLFKDYRGTRI